MQGVKTGIFFRLRKIFFPGWLVNRQVKITLLGWIYLGLIWVFGFSAINTGNNLLYLIFAIMVSLLIASFWLSEMSITELKISRHLPREVYAEKEFILKYELKNLKKFFPCCAIWVEEEIEGKKLKAYFPLVEAGKSQSHYSRLSLKKRGRCQLKQLTIKTRFPFGFFEKGKKIRMEEEIIVFPSLVKPKEFFPRLSEDLGELFSWEKGAEGELFGFRDYQFGDHPHLISWKISAKKGELLVRENLKEGKEKVIIELKITPHRWELDSQKRERKISQAMSLSKFLLEKGFQVRVEINRRGVEFGRGIFHLRKIGYFLALFDDSESPERGDVLSLASPYIPRFII